VNTQPDGFPENKQEKRRGKKDYLSSSPTLWPFRVTKDFSRSLEDRPFPHVTDFFWSFKRGVTGNHNSPDGRHVADEVLSKERSEKMEGLLPRGIGRGIRGAQRPSEWSEYFSFLKKCQWRKRKSSLEKILGKRVRISALRCRTGVYFA